MAYSTSGAPGLRRALSHSTAKEAPASDPQIESLYTLPQARIIEFRTSGSRPDSRNGAISKEDESVTRSWGSRFERTIAVGPLRIYRAPGSVAFLNCQNALRPILPKSQAWCVDGNGMFVLKLNPPLFWRIECPTQTADDIQRLGDMKIVLDQVLKFDKTECPFHRNFKVALPDPPKTPVKKKPWEPIHIPTITSSLSMGTVSSYPNPQNTQALPATRLPSINSPVQLSIGRSCSTSCLKMPSHEDSAAVMGITPNLVATINEVDYGLEQALVRHSIQCTDNIMPLCSGSNGGIPGDQLLISSNSDQDPRSELMPNTAPPALSSVTCPASKRMTKLPLRISTTEVVDSSPEVCSSSESFHSVQSWHSPLDPCSPVESASYSPADLLTYPYPHENILLPKRASHTRDISELTVVPQSPDAIDYASDTELNRRSLSPTPPTLIDDRGEKSDEELQEIVTPPRHKSALRPTAHLQTTTSSSSRQRQLSSLSPPTNLLPPRTRGLNGRHQSTRDLPAVIIQKTCEILLSPPSHLLHLMLSIASKIAAGEWSGVLSGYGDAVHWDFKDEYGDNRSTTISYRPHVNKSNTTGGSWEVD